MIDPEKQLKLRINQSLIMLFTVMAILGTMFCANVFAGSPPNGQSVDTIMSAEKAGVTKYALISAGVAFAFAALGGGIAISHVGAAAMGAIAEKPQVGGQALIFVALAEGVVVLGIVMAFLILKKA